MYRIVGKLNRLKKVLRQLNKDKFSDVEKKEEIWLQKLLEYKEEIQKDPRNEGLSIDEKKMTKEYMYWKEAKIKYLQQRSKVQWIKQGDMNTRYFHSVIKAKRIATRIFTIHNSQGKQCKQQRK